MGLQGEYAENLLPASADFIESRGESSTALHLGLVDGPGVVISVRCTCPHLQNSRSTFSGGLRLLRWPEDSANEQRTIFILFEFLWMVSWPLYFLRTGAAGKSAVRLLPDLNGLFSPRSSLSITSTLFRSCRNPIGFFFPSAFASFAWRTSCFFFRRLGPYHPLGFSFPHMIASSSNLISTSVS